MELIETNFKIVMAKYPITNKEYEKFDPYHQRCKCSDLDNQPVVYVSWDDACAYCEWLTRLTKKEYRLPFSVEWEMVASGNGKRKYPWGDNEPTKNHANFNNNIGHTTIVGNFQEGATPEGLFGMAGNVWEWCVDLYDENQNFRVLRGGSWDNLEIYLPCSFRLWLNPGIRGDNVGFRVVCGA